MNNIGMEFLKGTPDGPRRIFEANWSGECLMCSRARIESILVGELFDVSGVYVLVGPSKAGFKADRIRFESELYVGQGDSVGDRIQSHLKKKDFWKTALVFHRPHRPLNAGNIKYLESRLVQLAGKAGNCVLNNGTVPQIPSLAPTEKIDTEQFLTHMLFVLQALGFDFFTKLEFAPEAAPEEVVHDIKIPAELKRLVNDLKVALLKFPNTELYFTKTPDYRAKVVAGNSFRVFARLKFRKHRLKVELKDVDKLELEPNKPLEQRLLEKIAEAHSKAQEYLNAKAL